MPRKRLLRGVILCLLCLPALASCFLRPRGAIELEPTPDLAMGRSWALVTEPYVQFREEPSVSAGASAHARKGDIAPVEGMRIIAGERGQDVWYLFGPGWLPSSSVRIFPSEASARTAASAL